MATYKYDKLEHPQDFRVVVLNPGKGQEEVICQLTSASIEDAPKFEALSYTWGDPNITHPIVCSDAVAQVTVNLYDALRHLRHPDSPRTLWVDAICINQQDVEEKNKQVSFMGKIYSSAERVLVWLGKESEDDRGAFEDITTASLFISPFIKDLVDLDRVSKYNWAPILNLFRRPYFQRKWVVQEIIKARQTLAICGNETVPWIRIERLAYGMSTKTLGSYIPQIANDEKWDFRKWTETASSLSDGIQNAAGISFIRQNPERDFVEAMVSTRGLQCLNPSDRIFAIVGILCHGYADYEELRPDYTSKYEDILRRCTLLEILKRHDLRILSCVETGLGNIKLTGPSWMPHFGNSLSSGLGMRRPALFHAGGSSTVQARASDNDGTLHIFGKVLGKIQEIVPNPISMPLEITEAEITKLMTEAKLGKTMAYNMIQSGKWVEQCRKFAAGGRQTLSDERFNEFWRTMMCDMGTPARATADYKTHFADYVQISNQIINGRTVTKEFTAQCTVVDATIGYSMRTLQLCSTVEGRLGRVPQNAETGDLICIFFGGNVPYVIRTRDNGQFTFIGECYLHGVMDGEAMDMEEIKSEEFALV